MDAIFEIKNPNLAKNNSQILGWKNCLHLCYLCLHCQSITIVKCSNRFFQLKSNIFMIKDVVFFLFSYVIYFLIFPLA